MHRCGSTSVRQHCDICDVCDKPSLGPGLRAPTVIECAPSDSHSQSAVHVVKSEIVFNTWSILVRKSPRKSYSKVLSSAGAFVNNCDNLQEYSQKDNCT